MQLDVSGKTLLSVIICKAMGGVRLIAVTFLYGVQLKILTTQTLLMHAGLFGDGRIHQILT